MRIQQTDSQGSRGLSLRPQDASVSVAIGLPPLHPNTPSRSVGTRPSRLGPKGGAGAGTSAGCVRLVVFAAFFTVTAVSFLAVSQTNIFEGEEEGDASSRRFASFKGRRWATTKDNSAASVGDSAMGEDAPSSSTHVEKNAHAVDGLTNAEGLDRSTTISGARYEGSYRLAKPLPGQVTSDEYLKPRDGYSSWWCGGPPGNKDVFGKLLDPRHYCAIRNLCIVQGRPTLFVESKEEVPGMGQDEKVVVGIPHSAYARSYSCVIKANDKGETLRKAREEGRFKGGLTAIIASSHGQTHVTHIMESLGQLFYGLNILGFYQDHGEEGAYMKEPLSSNLVGAPAGMVNLSPFNRTVFALKYAELDRILLAGAGEAQKGSWVELFYRMLFTNKRIFSRPAAEGEGSKDVYPEGFAREEDFRPRIINSVESFNGHCFDEVVIAGASYDPYHQVHMPSFHRHRDWFFNFPSSSSSRSPTPEEKEKEKSFPGLVVPSSKAQRRIEQQQKYIQKLHLKSDDSRPPLLLVTQLNDVDTKRRPLRKVLIAHRSQKRTVANAAEFDKWFAEEIPVLLPEYDWVIRSVNFANLNNAHRVEMAHWADILVGIHGADLTNLVSMRATSALVELYPIFYFESRFYEMAQSMQLHYFAWTCTRSTCSPIDPKSLDPIRNGEVEYEEVSGRLRITGQTINNIESRDAGQREKCRAHSEITRLTDGWFSWPTDRYVGHECLGCDLVACCTTMQQSMYGPQRDSDVSFHEKEFEEMLALMRRAAAAAGTPFVPYHIKSYSERLQEAQVLNNRRTTADV